MQAKTINQNEMTAECWGVQFDGLAACERCEYKDTPDCGGQEIRKTGKNSKGFSLPLGQTKDGA